MSYNFDKLFPNVQLFGIGIMLIAFIIVIIIAFRTIKNKDKKDFPLWILTLLLLVIGIVVNSKTKYIVKDYIENKDYVLVIAKMGLLENTYVQADYKDYWEDMNWHTYRIDCENKVIYMRTNKFY